jgi:antitoxin component YwqK of YwqJK toxin-antitoxin module
MSTTGFIIDTSKPHITEKYYVINGVKHGEYKSYIDDEIKLFMNYVNGKLHGPCIEYYQSKGDSNPQPLHIYNYNNGLRHGMSLIYTHTGKIIEEEPYVNGELHGECKTFSIDGILLFIGKYINGLAEGEHIEYDEYGKIKKIYTYVNGKKHGPFWIYLNGEVIIHRYYENDKIQNK